MAIGEDSESSHFQRHSPLPPLPSQAQAIQRQQEYEPQLEYLSMGHYLPSMQRLSASSLSSNHGVSYKEPVSDAMRSEATTSTSNYSPSTSVETVGAAVGVVLPSRRTEELAAKVIDMGFPEEIVNHVIQLDVAETGGSYSTTEALLDAVMAYKFSMNDDEIAEVNRSVNMPVTSSNLIGESIQKDSSESANMRNSTLEQNSKQEKKMAGLKKKKSKGDKLKESRNQNQTDRRQLKKPDEDVYTDAEGLKENSAPSALWQELSSLELKEENKKMKSTRLCKICQENEIRMVLLPCGHLISCSDCISLIANCTLCNQAVKGSVKVFLA